MLVKVVPGGGGRGLAIVDGGGDSRFLTGGGDSLPQCGRELVDPLIN